MPRKHTRQGTRAGTVYHGYNRERNRAPMFRDDEDRRYFKSLFERHLSTEPVCDSRGRPYKSYRSRVHLWGLAVMTNHFHVALLQLEPGSAGALMKTVLARYVRYFNERHGGGGEMFLGEVRLRPSEDLRGDLNAVAYVHENHGDHCYCEFCTHGLYVGHPAYVPSWVDVTEALERFGGVGGYTDWLQARRLQRRVLERR